MSDNTDNQFIQKTFDGAPKVTRDATTAPKPRERKEFTPSKPVRRREYVAQQDGDYIRGAYSDILTLWYDAEPVDSLALILGRDPWGRKVEQHTEAWMVANAQDEGFKRGEVVTLTNGLMASTLVQGMVYREEPSIIQTLNSDETIKRAQEYINTAGTIEGNNTSPNIKQGSMTARILDDCITVGKDKSRMYLVEVASPEPMAGLKLMQFASTMVK
jgi:hypothetical protein